MEYHNPTLRVLRILELIDANSGGLSLSEISNLLALPKGTISPILKTLAATNYVMTDGSLYKIGPHTFELGLSYASGQNALSIIRSEMHSIVSQVDEVCQMGVLVGQDVHYLLKEEGHAIISIISDVGHHLPAHVTGLGKALLSGLTNDEVRQRDTASSPTCQTPLWILIPSSRRFRTSAAPGSPMKARNPPLRSAAWQSRWLKTVRSRRPSV